MSRLYQDLVASTDTGSTLVTKHNNNFDSVLSNHLSTTSGQPSYAVDGMLYINDQTGSGGGYEYFFIEDGTSIEAFTALLAADTSDKNWNLVEHQNWAIETLTSVPGTITQGRLVMVDTGTNDDGLLYISDASAYRRVLTNAVVSNTDNSLYYRTLSTEPDDSQGSILSLTSSSSVSWTTLDIATLLSSQFSMLGTAQDSLVLLNVRIKDSGGRALIKFRENGKTLDSGYKVVATVAAETGVYQYGQIWVNTNAGVIQYDLTASGASTADVDVRVEAVQVTS